MSSIERQLNEKIIAAFESAGVPTDHAAVKLSDRPELADYQCNGAMAAAKAMKKNPREIASEVAAAFDGGSLCEPPEIAGPGFLNIRLRDSALARAAEDMAAQERLGVDQPDHPQRIILDYGGPNVAKPLHIGHLRSAIIGESIKRILRFAGHEVAGDIHMGDWGYQMGLIIASIGEEQPDLPYFDRGAKPEDYPSDPPFTLTDLERIYPEASARAKEDDDFRDKALAATNSLQSGHPGYRALWQHIMDLSVADLKRNYARLNVDFDWWKGESDVQDLIGPMVEQMKADGYARIDDGALIVDVAKEDDKKEIPPCMILKSDGSALYATTDLATLKDRRAWDPDRIVYIVDKRQGLHFEQVFRCAKKTGITPEETELDFRGFGTMNGPDGQPYKTREGGVMRLSALIDEINAYMVEKVRENETVAADAAEETARIIGLAALKYGDLSNQASKDYVFSLERFASSDGNTGPYLLYTIVRIKSILDKYGQESGAASDGAGMNEPATPSERDLMLDLVRFPDAFADAAEQMAPHKICAYLYGLANHFNGFYRDVKILAEPDPVRKAGYIALLKLTLRVLEQGIDLLGFSAPDRM